MSVWQPLSQLCNNRRKQNPTSPWKLVLKIKQNGKRNGLTYWIEYKKTIPRDHFLGLKYGTWTIWKSGQLLLVCLNILLRHSECFRSFLTSICTSRPRCRQFLSSKVHLRLKSPQTQLGRKAGGVPKVASLILENESAQIGSQWKRLTPIAWTVPLTPNGLVDITAHGSLANIRSPEWAHSLPLQGC